MKNLSSLFLRVLFRVNPYSMKTLLLLFMSLGTNMLYSQNFEWAKRIGGMGSDNCRSVAVDASGNVYTTGGFEGTADFDPGPGEYLLTSAGYSDIFISKVDASGALVWIKQIGGDKADYGNAIALDPSGNVLTTGYFKDTVDFDPGPGSYVLLIDPYYVSPYTGTTYLKGADIFISKLDTDGNFVWAKQIGGNLTDFGTGIAVDGANNVITTGEYSNHYAVDSTDFDPGPGIYNLGEGGAFVSKLDGTGNFIWAKPFGWNNSVSSVCGGSACIYDEDYTVSFRAVALDASGNVYTTGSFVLTNDFDPGPGTFNLTSLGSRDAVVCKLNASGSFVWAKQFGGSGATVEGEDIAVDATGNVHTTGSFMGKVDFNPGSSTANLTSANPQGIPDIFISKLTSAGNYTWAKSVGGSGNDLGASIALDAQSNVYYTGYFNGRVDFDPGSAKYNLTASGNDCFISKLTAAGAFSWARQIGGSGDDRGNAVTIDGSNNVLTAGSFSNTVDFDPNTGIYNMISAGGIDGFIQKMNQSGGAVRPQDGPDIARAMNASVFPNPTSGIIHVQFDHDIDNGRIQLFNLNGQLLLEQNNVVGISTRMDLSTISNGLYLVSVGDGTGSSVVLIYKNE